jgi:hypothetical protein
MTDTWELTEREIEALQFVENGESIIDAATMFGVDEPRLREIVAESLGYATWAEMAAARAQDDVPGAQTAKALRDTLISPNELDSNLEAANVVDGLFAIARSLGRLAAAADRHADAATRIADALATWPHNPPPEPQRRWRVSEAEWQRTMRGAS